MKKLLFAVFALVLTLNISTAQEAYLKQEITEVKSDNKQMEQQLQMMVGGQTETFYKGDVIVSKVDMMGGMVVANTKADHKTGEMIMLIDAMGQKMLVETTVDKMQSVAKEQADKANIKVTYDKKDTKVIQGMKCYKFSTSTTQDGMEMKLDGYLTEEIKVKKNAIKGFEQVELKGLPLEMTISTDMFSMKTETIEIKKTVSDEDLIFNTEGAKKMTIEELQSMSGGAF